MKKLPSIYAGDAPVQNTNNKVYYSYQVPFKNKEEESVDLNLIETTLDDIFSKKFSYQIDVVIETSTKKYETRLVGRNNSYVLTIDNDKIPIIDIKRIQKKSRS